MTRPTARPIRGALSFLDLRSVADTAEDFVDAWAANKKAPDLIRSQLELRSDFGFVNDIKSALEDELTAWGTAKELAATFLPALLTSPSFSSAKPHGEDVLVRQAVLFERPSEDELEILVSVDVRLRAWQPVPGSRERIPASATCVTVTCDQFDMASDKDLGRVMAELVRMLREFPESRQNPRHASTAVTLLGDLIAVGTDNVPDNWRSDIDILAHAFNVRASFRREPTFNGDVADSTAHVIRFEPYEGVDPRTHGGAKLPFTKIQARTLSYDQVFHAVAVAFADLEEESGPDPYARRELKAGEKVFHRKVGNGRKFDRFDKGSESPCMHNSFVIWSKAPKAAKGFHRRYSNFQDAWLHHCSKGMNCGMYAAFVPQKI